jgi:hypothetical protein
MTVTININNLSLCHQGSSGVATATLPDVCKTPPGPVPVPYPNIAFSKHLKKGTKTIKVEGGKMAAHKGSEFSRSTGDEPGIAKGIKSNTQMKEASWLTYSFDVKLEGKNACRLTDKMLMNHGNTVCLAGEIQKILGISETEFLKKCKECKQTAKENLNWAKNMQGEYQKALNNPNNKTAQDIENAVGISLDQQGIKTEIAGTTDDQGNINVVPQTGPCAELENKATELHEKVHQRHQQELEKKYGKKTPAFERAWNNAKDWAQDDINAYGAEIDFWNKFEQECGGRQK